MQISNHETPLLNALWPSYDLWRQRSGSTLAQVMACCLTAPSHYLNQCWRIINEVQWHSYWEMPQPSITKICLKITCLKFHSNFPGGQWVNIRYCLWEVYHGRQASVSVPTGDDDGDAQIGDVTVIWGNPGTGATISNPGLCGTAWARWRRTWW